MKLTSKSMVFLIVVPLNIKCLRVYYKVVLLKCKVYLYICKFVCECLWMSANSEFYKKIK